jgi:hypothetical protein
VEYLVGRPGEQDLVRALARPLIANPMPSLAGVVQAWRSGISKAFARR